VVTQLLDAISVVVNQPYLTKTRMKLELYHCTQFKKNDEKVGDKVTSSIEKAKNY
jgi:hypothetical protein